MIEPSVVKEQPVGYFAPTYKLFLNVWDNLCSTLRPVSFSISNTDKRIKLINGGIIEGWSLDTDDPSRGRKYARVVIDEAGMVINLGELWRTAIRPTLIDLQGDAWFLGTPKVIAPDFNEFFKRGERGDAGWKSFRGHTFDNPFIPEEEKQAIHSERASMPDWEWRQEYEGEPAESASQFFPSVVIESQIHEFAREPEQRGTIWLPEEVREEEQDIALCAHKGAAVQFTDDAHGPWKLWFDGVPDFDGPLAIACDIGAGVGSSNTVFSVGFCETRRKVAEFASARVSPERAARLAVAAGWYFGGLNGPACINFEANGPGVAFQQQLARLGYPNTATERAVGTEKDRHAPKKRWGWYSTATAKESLLSNYRAALTEGHFENPSEMALRECLGYCYDKAGRVVSDGDHNDPADELARVPHGDRVIADALLWLTMKFARKESPSEHKYAAGSVGSRMRLDELRKKRGGMVW